MAIVQLNINEVEEFLLEIAMKRSVFIWGPPGIGKSTAVENFASSFALPCVTMLGSQMLPEDIMGAPDIKNGATYFNPPAIIKKDVPYCLFIDELNLALPEVQKAFYSLILDRRAGEYQMPEGSVVIGAGNRASDSALVNSLPSALMNRMVHINMFADTRIWLEWAKDKNVHPWVTAFIEANKSCLVTENPEINEPFSSPRSWAALSDCLYSFVKDNGTYKEKFFDASLYGNISHKHVPLFKSYVKRLKENITIESILKGKSKWPQEDTSNDLLLVLANDFKNYLIKSLPDSNVGLSGKQKALISDVNNAIKDLANIQPDMVRMILVDEQSPLPDWFTIDVSSIIGA